MRLANDSNSSIEIPKKSNILYDEVDLISTSSKIPNASSIVVSPKNTKIEFSSADLVFGTSIDIHNPRKMGAINAFLYIKGFPLIVIGPDCK